MDPLDGRLADLARKLDALGPTPSLVDLAEALESSRLTRADVERFARPNPHHYNRAPVVSREKYEVLVMTWLPGQASLPHDHAGSMCLMQVIEGEAVEGSYRVGPDGYVDLDFETTIRTGQVTSGQDQGVHTLRNASPAGQSLVTVHVYWPPLRDFRRFIPRTQAPSAPPARTIERPPTIVVVGGGFSGSMTAAQILRRAGHQGLRAHVVLIERRGAIGEGLAYGTRDPVHLLNVPAGKMSAWPDRPDDLVRWASARHRPVAPGQFLPREWYGQYVRETLLDTAEQAGPTATLHVLLDEVRRIAHRPTGGWLIHLATGGSLDCDAVVLAIGHREPSDPLARKWTGPRHRFIADPWRPFAMNVIRPDESVVMLGCGLTAVDAVMSLANRGRVSITLVSRHGLLPQAHWSGPLPPVDLQPLVSRLTSDLSGVRALDLLRALRRKARELAPQGINWRAVIDGLRPHTATLWQAMPLAERRKFLSRLRPFWEIHRHRMALAVAETFGAMRESQEVASIAGRLIAAQAEGQRVRLTVQERKTGRDVTLDADWVVNCTGPAPSNSAAANPAIGSLLVDGHLRADELGLGIDTTDEGNAIGTDGKPVIDLLIVGTLRKPAMWESTAVPELRQQAAVAGARALALATSAARRSSPPSQVVEPKTVPR